MTFAPEVVRAFEFYDPQIQLSPIQLRVIAGVVAEHNFAARFLIHGCGLDSPFWHALNAHGHTLFIEHDANWAEHALQQAPNIEIAYYPQFPTTVDGTEKLVDVKVLSQVKQPAWAQEQWDIVLIDGPQGFLPEHPGRSLPIFWAASTLQVKADIFVDDYDRPLEKLYCEKLLRNNARFTAVLPGKQAKKMFWRCGSNNNGHITRSDDPSPNQRTV